MSSGHGAAAGARYRRRAAASRYFRCIAKVITVPWDIAVGGDLANPAVAGRRTAKIRLANAYLPRLHAAAASDPALARAFVRVSGACCGQTGWR